MNHTARNVIITIVVVAIIAVAAFFGYRAFAGANESSAKGSKGNPVKIGVVGATNPEWVKFKQDAEKAGIYVDIVDFQDYTSENPALDSGELDLNEFQHLLYLANYNVSNKKDLQPIGGTAIYPLGVYSTKVKDIKDLKQGDTVTIPNDETNQARAIGVLKAAGLVSSTSDANRNIDQGGVRIEGEKVSDKGLKLKAGTVVTVQVGKRKWARITIA